MTPQRILDVLACTGLAAMFAGLLLLIDPALGFSIAGAVMFWLAASPSHQQKELLP